MSSGKESSLSNYNKWKYTLITTFIFLVISNPTTYVFVNNTIGKLINIKVSNGTGCPTSVGMLIHAVIFTLILRVIMG